MAEGAAWRPGHVVNLSEVLVEVLDNIVDQHFPVATWTREELTRNFIPVKKFIDAVRVFCSIDSVDVRVDIAAEAIRLRKFRANNLCTCKEFYQFCLWLKKPEGMLIVNAAQRRMRLAKKVQEGLTVDDVAIISIAHEQRSEFHQSQKIKRATYTDYISELRRMISVAEEEMAADLAAGKDEYLPTSEWEEPDDMTIAELCWERYGNICAAEDRIQLELNEENLAEITVNYSEEIRNRKWKEFLAQGTRRDDLKVWAERRILELERAGEKKRSGTFRHYMENSGGEVAQEVRAAAEERSVARVRGRESHRRPRLEVDPTNILTDRLRKRLRSALNYEDEAANQPPIGGGPPDDGVPPVQQQVGGGEGAAVPVGGGNPP
ncbi:TPA_asm: hypothetical protein [Myosoton aquaticum amalgavirus 1]|nr:TPA_asm: hypothetical protein [Myosoton aquaticum amalgavirus 1]